MSKKKTTKQFKKEVYAKVKAEYEVLGEYINSKTPIMMKHNLCGHSYTVLPSNFLRGSRCPKCFGTTKKKTTDEFRNEVYKLFKDEYEILGEYINANTYIKVKHNKCGYIYDSAKPNTILRGSGCPNCAKNKKKTTKEFKQEVYDLVGDEYEVLEEYTGALTPVKMKHTKCNHVYDVIPNRFLRGSRCPKCFGVIKKKTIVQFKQEVYDLVGDEYEVVGEYINTDTSIDIKHNVCGNVFKIEPKHFLYKKGRCPICLNRNRMTLEEFKDKICEVYNNEYEVIGDYIDSNIPVEVKHVVCNQVFDVKPKSLLNGKICPHCMDKKSGKLKKVQKEKKRTYRKKNRPNKKTTKQFKQEVHDLVGDEYIVLGKYVNSKTHVKIRHNKCNHVYTVRPDKFLYKGNRCPKCSSSKGELYIGKFLDKHNINYKHDKSYGNCSYKSPLRFDFLIFDDEENLKLIVEFDGIHHFEAVKSFGGEENLREVQLKDEIKNNFCKENNIHLLRIPYWDINNIDEILHKELYKLELI